jgi:hypothetical protein
MRPSATLRPPILGSTPLSSSSSLGSTSALGLFTTLTTTGLSTTSLTLFGTMLWAVTTGAQPVRTTLVLAASCFGLVAGSRATRCARCIGIGYGLSTCRERQAQCCYGEYDWEELFCFHHWV